MLSQDQIDAIPQELRALPQWVGAQDKIPLRPKDGGSASVTDPSTWGTFDQAIVGLELNLFTHIGFVFTSDDPYVFIDLDAPKDGQRQLLPQDHPLYIEHQKKCGTWIKAFGSYSEKSASGHGIHIIVKGKLANAMKMPGTELYFTERYAIFTGDVVSALPIASRQDELDQIVQGIKAGAYKSSNKAVYIHSAPNDAADRPILNKIGTSSNATAIRELWEGRWQGNYPSQSEADHALLAHLCFYSKDDAQVARIFRTSQLGQRQKANNRRDPYVEQSIMHIRATEPQPIDFSNFKLPAIKEVHTVRQVNRTYPRPPDVLGDIADFIYGASIHPVKEVAYAGAIAWAAGVMGRHFNISGTGLNQYVLLLAGTGKGKEGASDGIDLIYQSLRPSIPEIENFRGPSNLASGPGLIRTLSEREAPVALAIVGEFGLRLCAMVDPRANAAEITLKAALLDLFSKSGEYKTLSPIAYSDSTKNTKLLESPALSILGVSTPETFFNKLTEASVLDGLIPRFLTVVYQGQAKESSENRVTQMDPALQAKLLKAVEVSIYMSRNNSFCHIQMTEAARKLTREFELLMVRRMNDIGGETASVALLNRAHLKVLRLAGLVACLANPMKPQVTETHAKWAIDFVETDLAYMGSRFETGDVGEGDSKQLSVLRERLKAFVGANPPTKNPKWIEMLRKGVVPYSLISQVLLSKSCFTTDRRGANSALAICLKELVSCGEIREIPTQQVSDQFGTSSRAFLVVEG
jgi:hypothetical protein